MAITRVCSIPNCGNPARARGWCRCHYERWYIHGDTEPRERPGSRSPARTYFETVVLPHTGEACLIWPFARNPRDGYGQMRMEGKTVRVHRAVCIVTHGQPPTDQHHAAHSCGNGDGGCVNPNHLRWATPSENEEDKRAHGTFFSPTGRGRRPPNFTKLTEDQVRYIRHMAETTPRHDIAKMFGIGTNHVTKIVTRQIWASLI